MMGVETKTIYTCDCCGRESDRDDFNNGSECGSSKLSIAGSIGGRSYNGGWGGANHSIKQLLCFQCARRLINFYGEMKEEMNAVKEDSHD